MQLSRQNNLDFFLWIHRRNKAKSGSASCLSHNIMW